MKAVLMTNTGTPDVLKFQEVSTPQIETDTQVLVKLYAAGVNPIDTKLRKRGTLYPEQMPAILGCDGAGVITGIGNQVKNFKVGDQVYFCYGGLGAKPGNYAEYIVVEENFLSHKPNNLSFVEAAVVPLILITAWESLYDRGRLEPGRKVLIHAGSGGVGHIAIQLAKLKGAEVCTTVSTPEKADFVKSLGADHVILYRENDFVKSVLDWTDGLGVDLAFDTVGGDLFTQTFSVVQMYGDLVTILQPDANTNWTVARNRNLRISLELMLTPLLQSNLVEFQKHQAQILHQGARLIDEGKLKVHLNQTFPLSEAKSAHELLEKGGMIGKIGLLIS
ncbi:MAG TPA: zinc-dependent alcohol dehydrogenase family protein [Allocoleopsis sp.]